MAITATELSYPDGDTQCKGVVFTPDNASGPLPVVLVTHAWDGLVQEVRDKAEKLASAGYIAFAIDVYGNGTTLRNMTELDPIIGPLMADRSLLLKRMQAAVDAAKTIPGADVNRIAAIGYCFGGLCVLDLARGGGDDVKAAVLFHGSLLPNGLEPNPIKAKILALHGNDDPLVPPEQVIAFYQEMKQANADWQLVAYGNTVHAFTRPEANDREMGAVYSEVADRRSWREMLNFFEDEL